MSGAASFAAAAALLAALLAPAAAKEGAVIELKAFGTREAPAAIPADFNGRGLNLILDTGSEVSILDAALVPQEKGLEANTAHGVGGAAVSVRQGLPPDALTVFGSPLKASGPVGYADLTSMTAAAGRPVDGFLGMSFLQNYVVQLDFDARLARFLDRNVRSDRSLWGTAFPLGEEDGVPTVGASLIPRDGPERPMTCQVVTGLDDTGILPEADFDAARSEKMLVTHGVADEVEGRVRLLRLGRLEYRDLIFQRGDKCVLGRAFLARHLATFDFPGKKLYLKAGAAFQVPETYDMAAVSFVRDGKRPRVLDAAQDGPAYKAGLRAGDVLETVMGKDAAELDLYEIRRLFRSKNGRRVEIEISRGGKKKRIVVVLQNRL